MKYCLLAFVFVFSGSLHAAFGERQIKEIKKNLARGKSFKSKNKDNDLFQVAMVHNGDFYRYIIDFKLKECFAGLIEYGMVKVDCKKLKNSNKEFKQLIHWVK